MFLWVRRVIPQLSTLILATLILAAPMILLATITMISDYRDNKLKTPRRPAKPARPYDQNSKRN